MDEKMKKRVSIRDMHLARAKDRVKLLRNEMLSLMRENNTQRVIQKAVDILGEFNNSGRGQFFTPREYHQLYSMVTEALDHLESYIAKTFSKNNKCKFGVLDLYEHVQHSGQIIPRLFLMIAVGSVAITQMRAPAKDILFDLVEICSGVQHPMRGLFLRNYLSRTTQSKLPDKGSQYEGLGGNVRDAIEFVLRNFVEMIKLWVRMREKNRNSSSISSSSLYFSEQSRMVPSSSSSLSSSHLVLDTFDANEEERSNLKELVGAPLNNLSHISGLDLDLYRQVVLPRILEQTVNCKDVMAQEYLMEAIIKAFAADFHLSSLQMFLETLVHLQQEVNSSQILMSMMHRLSTSADALKLSESDSFPLIHHYSSDVVRLLLQTSMKKKKLLLDGSITLLFSILELQAAQMKFCLQSFPSRSLQYADGVLAFTVSTLRQSCGPREQLDQKSAEMVRLLLTLPLYSLGIQILHLEFYLPLLSFLAHGDRREIAGVICGAVVQEGSKLDTIEKVSKLFKYLEPSLEEHKTRRRRRKRGTNRVRAVTSYDDDDDDDDNNNDEDDDNNYDNSIFVREQENISLLFQLIQHPDTDQQYELYKTVRQQFGRGGKRRMRHSIPPLVFGALDLIVRIVAKSRTNHDQFEDNQPKPMSSPSSSLLSSSSSTTRIRPRHVFVFIHQILSSAYANFYPESAICLFLKAAKLADSLSMELIAYEFVAQAFVICEDEVDDADNGDEKANHNGKGRNKSSISSTRSSHLAQRQKHKRRQQHQNQQRRFRVISIIVSTLETFHCFSLENWNSLVLKASQLSAKLKSSRDKARSIANCSHLYWPSTNDRRSERDAKILRHDRKLIKCLQRALKAANECYENQIELFVEILNKYIFFYEEGCTTVGVKYLQGLICLIQEHIHRLDDTQIGRRTRVYYMNTLEHVRQKKKSEGKESPFSRLDIEELCRASRETLERT
mmetsp:Transcript_8754/g.14191  ORF Transcript_8754/g.14191 Transcript_8754/m.14191 type:complete len:953 (+) Transcript_8754:148-3006(+)